MAQSYIDRAIQTQAWLDQLASPIQRFVNKTLEPGPTGTPLRNILHGTFLGHPLHPVLTDVSGGRVSAMSDTCTHMGCSLAEGKLEGTTVTCPCHGSQFDVLTGLAVRGPASVPEARHEVSILAGRIKLRPAGPK